MKTKFNEEVEHLIKLLRNEHGENGVLVSQHEFCVDFRARVARNGSSTGLDALDDLAMAILNGDDAALLTGTVVLLPTPDAMTEGTAHSSVPSPNPACVGQEARAPWLQKVEGAVDQEAAQVPQEVNLHVQPALLHPRNDQDHPGEHRAGGYEPGPRSASHRVSWADQRCWYNSKLYPELHVQHYRSWMRHRAVCFGCALYTPS